MSDQLAGRAYARVYRVSGRADLRDFLITAVERSGATVLYASDPARAPVYLGVQAVGDERLGLLCYPFRCNPSPINGRPLDEHRVQIRYGGEKSWGGDHSLGLDVAGVDVTLVVGVHLHGGILVGLDPLRYDPLPMGISVEFKDADVDAVLKRGWHVWERVNQPGMRRKKPRAFEGLETLVAFRPERLLDYARLEREATSLELDPPLRFRAANAAATTAAVSGGTRHALEREFALSSDQILEVIATRTRLAVAVRGGIAEHHLERYLQEAEEVAAVQRLDRDAHPDFEVTLVDGRSFRIECKNASPVRYANGDLKVEVQKTRASRGDAASRLYRLNQFKVVAACLFSATGRWEFRFKATVDLVKDAEHQDRIAPIQRIDRSWATRLGDAAMGSVE